MHFLIGLVKYWQGSIKVQTAVTKAHGLINLGTSEKVAKKFNSDYIL